jgi:hypothetical protein
MGKKHTKCVVLVGTIDDGVIQQTNKNDGDNDCRYYLFNKRVLQYLVQDGRQHTETDKDEKIVDPEIVSGELEDPMQFKRP